MKNSPLLSLAAAAAALLLCASPLSAQQKRISPHETVSTVVNGDRVTVVYGRPYSKDPTTGEVRKIWGGLVPYDQVWRAGADEATLLITEKPLVFGTEVVPAGAYTLWLLPKSDGTGQLLINKQIGQWGIKGHNAPANRDPALDVASVNLVVDSHHHPVSQFTIAVDKKGILKFEWETTKYSAPFKVAK